MNKLTNTLTALTTAALVCAGSTSASDLASTGALPTPANRIVGLWSNVASVGPCGGTPTSMLRQTIMFSTGGTFVDNSRFPTGGVPNANGVAGLNQRSIGLGTWEYTPRTGQYSLTQRFDWFVNNQYHGYQVVERTRMLLSSDGNTLASLVRTVRYAADGAVVAELCGTATSTRV